LLAADRDFGVLFVVHLEHVAGLEPGHDFLDVMDVDEVGAMGRQKESEASASSISSRVR
jgi:hypothetical protein